MNTSLPRLMALLALFFAVGVQAQSGPPSGQGNQGNRGNQQGERRGPPPEAISACSGKAENASCGFTSPRGPLSGTCRNVPEGKMACVPANMPGHGGGQGGGQGGNQAQQRPQ